MLCGRLGGFDMLSVPLPALARIVDLLHFSFDFSAESLYVAFGAAETAVAATPPRPTASTAAPAASLLLLMLPSTRVSRRGGLRRSRAAGSGYASRPIRGTMTG